MSVQVVTYSVHQEVWPLLTALTVGWVAVLFGTLRWGPRFAAVALPVGLIIPASQFVPKLWRALLVPEVVAWNSAYWLIPAFVVSAVAVLIRRARRAA